MKLPCLFQFRILKLALTSLFGKPFTTKFPVGEYEPIEEFRGRPRFSADECIGCGACAEVCPADCIDQVDDGECRPPMRRLVQHFDACITCGQCERHCTSEKGIRLTNEYDSVGFCPEDFEETVEKELLLCETCGAVIAPVAQLKWLVKRLGPLVYTNPTLMLVSHDQLTLLDQGVRQGTVTETSLRAQRVSIQCPKCRRKSALTV